ncbi:CAP domain-containing protein [Modestobacter sp. VKM Ac-2983]|nr:CAP domain-containing protein [Modestobacter sp. VKM Ac-2983]MCZ2806414.1 CAP domain-containing protein [Modestobacter sp. VKM Ac-2983]
MRDRDSFSHINSEGPDFLARARARAARIGYARAKDIASGQPDAAAVMAAWMASPGHRHNILDCRLVTLGFGVAEGPGGPWWAQLFGACCAQLRIAPRTYYAHRSRPPFARSISAMRRPPR